MLRDNIAFIFSWISMGMTATAVLSYFFLGPVIICRIAFGLGVLCAFIWAYLLSTPGKPLDLDAILRKRNAAQGHILVESASILVGDLWDPARISVSFELAAGVYDYVTKLDPYGVIVRFRMSPNSGQRGFFPASHSIPVDTGFLIFIDSAWEDRGVTAKEIEKDVFAVLDSAEPLSLVVNDRRGKPAGVVIGTGLGDGTYTVSATDKRLSVSFV